MTMITTTVPPLPESDDAGDVDADEAAVGSAVLADEAVAPVAASVEAAVVEPVGTVVEAFGSAAGLKVG